MQQWCGHSSHDIMGDAAPLLTPGVLIISLIIFMCIIANNLSSQQCNELKMVVESQPFYHFY